MNISENVVYIGVNDKKIDLFEGQYKVPNGISYNSYAIIDEKIAKEEKLSLADKAFGSLHFSVCNLVKILSERHSVRAFSEVYTTYLALYNEHMGIEEVEAVTAVPMSESQLAALKAKLVAETGKKIIIKNTVDPTILGGVKLRYAGKQIDGSVKTRLDAFSESLKNIIV